MRTSGWALIQCDGCPSKKGRFEHRHKGDSIWRHGVKTVIYKPRGEAWKKATFWHLNIGLLVSRTEKQHISVVNSPSTWRSVVAALANEYTPWVLTFQSLDLQNCKMGHLALPSHRWCCRDQMRLEVGELCKLHRNPQMNSGDLISLSGPGSRGPGQQSR